MCTRRKQFRYLLCHLENDVASSDFAEISIGLDQRHVAGVPSVDGYYGIAELQIGFLRTTVLLHLETQWNVAVVYRFSSSTFCRLKRAVHKIHGVDSRGLELLVSNKSLLIRAQHERWYISRNPRHSQHYIAQLIWKFWSSSIDSFNI